MVLLARLKAGLFVLLLIGGLIAGGVIGTQMLGSKLAQNGATAHAQGKIVKITGPEKDFQLRLPNKKVLSFRCGAGCRASLAHLQRHWIEQATTDVYYLATSGEANSAQLLQAVYVD